MNGQMSRPATSGKVAHCPPGALIITAEAATSLARFLNAQPAPYDPTTRLIIADINRLARTIPPSREPLAASLPISENRDITTAEAARRTGLTSSAIRKRIAKGIQPARHDGRRWLINSEELITTIS